MTRKRPPAKKGSEKWIQLAVNDYPGVLYDHVAPQLHMKPSRISWLSPLRNDEYTEYSDQKFIDCLGLILKNRTLDRFWPKQGGPNWDGLAKTDRCQVLLVEAKAHIDEMKRPGSNAKDCGSIKTIALSLKKTQKFLDANQTVDWSKYPHYQYANRLAHLYLLAELNGIDAYLLMIYFLNDEHKKGPKCIKTWKEVVQKQHVDMGLRQDHRLSDRIVNLYLDVRELGG
ncbi:MAG: hypothetical protein OXG26_10780 [Caldilineaceae bacterium]|nr:hypothetical protein [Caldilineaceae bacterium]